MLDRRLTFSFRIGPILDRLLPELLLAEAERLLAFPVEGARLFGDPNNRSRTLGTCRLPSLEPESSVEPIRFIFISDNG